MALKGQHTTTGFIQWDNLMQLLLKLNRDNEHKFRLLISIGCFTGLRISDTLSLTWEQVLEQDAISLNEKKTKKHRRIKINADLKTIITESYVHLKSPTKAEPIFINRYGTKTIRVQYVNKKLKQIFADYGIRTANASSHVLRKTMGRRVWELNNYSEKSLVLLSEIFNHSSVQITKRYLGIKEQEIFDVYDQLSL